VARVLIADDDWGVRDMLTLALEGEGIEVDAVGSGREVLKALSRATVEDWMYDAMVLDIIMPGIDGWQVLEAIKANPLWSEVPVVVVSGVARTPTDIVRVSDYDSMFVEKQGNFLAAIRAVLGRLMDAA